MKFTKQIISMTFMFILFITACSHNEALQIVDDNYHPETDYQYYFHTQGNGQIVAESEDGYYFLNGSYLYYMDKQSMEPILFDARPNHDCAPDKNIIPGNCHAFFLNNGVTFQGSVTYYKGHLYVLYMKARAQKDLRGPGFWDYVLVRMDKNGSNRKIIRTFNIEPSPLIIHRDQIYFVENAYIGSGSKSTIQTIPLSDPDQEPVVLYSGYQFYDLKVYGNFLYISEWYQDWTRQIKLDLMTREYEIMYEEQEGNPSILDIRNGNLYAHFPGNDISNEASWNLYRSDLHGNGLSKLPIRLPIISWLRVDDKHYYLTPVSWWFDSEEFAHVEKAMVIYDDQYREIDRVDLSENSSWFFVITGNDRHMFIHDFGTTRYQRMYVLDKSKIGTGDAKFTLLAESIFPKP